MSILHVFCLFLSALLQELLLIISKLTISQLELLQLSGLNYWSLSLLWPIQHTVRVKTQWWVELVGVLLVGVEALWYIQCYRALPNRKTNSGWACGQNIPIGKSECNNLQIILSGRRKGRKERRNSSCWFSERIRKKNAWDLNLGPLVLWSSYLPLELPSLPRRTI